MPLSDRLPDGHPALYRAAAAERGEVPAELNPALATRPVRAVVSAGRNRAAPVRGMGQAR